MAVGMADSVVDSVGYDDRVRAEGAGTEWRRRTETLHFWHVLTALAREISALSSVEERVAYLESLIGRAVSTTAAIDRSRVRIEKRPYQLAAWIQALQTFGTAIAEGEV